jgi:hypothetical protein
MFVRPLRYFVTASAGAAMQAKRTSRTDAHRSIFFIAVHLSPAFFTNTKRVIMFLTVSS